MKYRLGALVALLAFGCSEPTPDDMPIDLAGPASDGGDVGPCKGNPAEGQCVVRVTGQVLSDEAAAPLADTFLTFCGSICFSGTSDANGRFDVPVKRYVDVPKYSIHVHGRPDRVDYYSRVPAVANDALAFAAPLGVPRLPASGPLLLLDGSAQTVTHGDATLEIAAGTKVTLDLEDENTGDVGKQFRALRITDPKRMPFVDAAAPPDLLYVFSPFEVKLSQKARLTFANGTSIPAGTKLDVLSQRGLDITNPPSGVFDRVAGAGVSADGQRIELDVGDGVTTLTWIALKRR